MKTDNENLKKLRSWLIEDTGSEAEADHLLPVIERLCGMTRPAADAVSQRGLTNRLIEEHRANQPETPPERTVVCIDDDASMIDLVHLILGARGYRVLGAMSGPDALQLVSKVRPDLVLLDLMMPDMDGWDVYQRMRADETMRSIPVIIVTAKAQTIDRVLGLNIAKVEDYITKPFSPIELMDSISKILGRVA